ncbi:MAG: exodeoxyribonuclease VII large subunit, partial [Alphaproteobacteria bacterium]|nr:exodeoxyribonuclease VII large subunit [Alphaproteobacteria bacterium]
MTEFPPVETEQPIYSVSIISKALKDVVEGQFSSVRVKGEVTGLKRHTSGHIYFALKDADAVMDAVCWRGTGKVTLLREGLEIIAFGKITTYPGRSKYQMIVSAFDPTGEGALLQVLLQLKEKLLKEGLFEQRFKKNLPAFPKRIGLITSPTGAVLKDIMHRLRERYPCHVLIKPVLVQGEGAAKQVTEAIALMNALPDDLRPDVLIVARGGGSLEDLFAF